ncbi:hypothetical protein IJ674_02105 [bacterium]|jgi:hypothetical protein|nr:hypothetical protein [bacterium]MBR1618671.1 hypothetical protein [bacterium]
MSDDKVVSLGSKKSKAKEHKEEEQKQELVYCSFCGRPNTQVIKMIEGPGVNICSECTMIALQYFVLEDRIPCKEAQQILKAFWGKAK